MTEPLSASDAAALARDPDDAVREALSTNPAAPAGALALLADDPNPAIRANLLVHPNAPADLRYQVHAGLRADAAAGDREAENALAWLRYDRSGRNACDRPA
ncbi:hypothetical protein [Saccharothrix lopnurensis]|uniref:Leucine rich repeat (LRR) protein n=1 Tax=Saccharothrix lopnurensis TaxID=1670621 RepID=A0ABW1P1L2_9PSEU